jgi:hypothetical protein
MPENQDPTKNSEQSAEAPSELSRRDFVTMSVAAGLAVAALPPRQASALGQWASTNIANLQHHPLAALVVSAFLPAGSTLAWLVLIPLAMFGATRPLGNLRLAAVCAAGHVIGTLVSEGIEAYRAGHGSLPPSADTIIDIGPSYVVVAAIVIALLYGSRTARIAAALDLAALVFIGHIFQGLGRLDVAAVGHVTAMVVAAVLGVVLGGRELAPARRAWTQRRVLPSPVSGGPGQPVDPLGELERGPRPGRGILADRGRDDLPDLRRQAGRDHRWPGQHPAHRHHRVVGGQVPVEPGAGEDPVQRSA